MLERRPVFPNVIEINHQLGYVVGCNIYLIYSNEEWILIDIGYEEVVEEVVDLIRNLDFPFANCKTLIATHADVDHIQGLAQLKQVFKPTVSARPLAEESLRIGDKLKTFAQIEAQGIDLDMPPGKGDNLINDGDKITVGDLELEVWLTPGHTDSQLSFRMGDLLFSGDNISRDGCVGAIDAHHGSNLDDFI